MIVDWIRELSVSVPVVGDGLLQTVLVVVVDGLLRTVLVVVDGLLRTVLLRNLGHRYFTTVGRERRWCVSTDGGGECC